MTGVQTCALRSRRHNPEGDTLYIDGSVTRKYISEGRKLVDFNLSGNNQDGELSIHGHATAELPARG